MKCIQGSPDNVNCDPKGKRYLKKNYGVILVKQKRVILVAFVI